MNFANLYHGETCVIIGNGPSLREIPLRLLRKYRTFGTNRIYLLDGFVPSFYVSVNPLVIEQSVKEINALPCPKFIRHNLAGKIPGSFPLRNLADRRFHADPTGGIEEGWTVTYVCMQLAYWMGFTTVLLVGVDHRYQQEGKPNQEVTATQPDPNHFDPNYFGPGTRWHLADLERSRLSYITADLAYKASGRRIVNLTPGTALDVFYCDRWEAWL